MLYLAYHALATVKRQKDAGQTKCGLMRLLKYGCGLGRPKNIGPRLMPTEQKHQWSEWKEYSKFDNYARR